MLRPISFYIALRYIRAKRRNHFISFISLASMLGIALGIAVLITVLSVMNGFDYQIHNKIFTMVDQVTINDASGGISNWQGLSKQVQGLPDVVAVAPYVLGQGMVGHEGAVQGVMIKGIIPEQEQQVFDLGGNLAGGKLNALASNSFNIFIGQKLADILGVDVGDKIMLITPQATLTPVGVVPRFKRFNVAGIFHLDDGFGYESGFVFMHMQDAQKLFQLDGKASALRLKIKDLYSAPKVTDELIKKLPIQYVVSDWTQRYSSYFKAIRMEKTIMFVILLFIIAVAAFNLVASLVMTVTDKQADIAILRTLGAAPATIRRIFMLQGMLVGLLGTIFGIGAGILLAIYAPNIVAGIEHTFHTHFISASIYFIDYLPSRLDWHYVVYVSLVALIMSLIATIYPAWKAATVQPAEALRYE